jgi:hypothetical protein
VYRDVVELPRRNFLGAAFAKIFATRERDTGIKLLFCRRMRVAHAIDVKTGSFFAANYILEIKQSCEISYLKLPPLYYSTLIKVIMQTDWQRLNDGRIASANAMSVYFTVSCPHRMNVSI